jgi:hypothetical protein
MNGRVYDYNLGRFMSVDPFIQSPTSTQSVNPYSYIMNNPLAGTDPTGYVGCSTGTHIKGNDAIGCSVAFDAGSGGSRKKKLNATITHNGAHNYTLSAKLDKETTLEVDFKINDIGSIGSIASGGGGYTDYELHKMGYSPGTRFFNDLGDPFTPGGMTANEHRSAMNDASGIAAIGATLFIPGPEDVLIGIYIASRGAELIAKAVSIFRGADVVKGIPISRTKYGEAADHIADAQKAGHSDVLEIAREGASGNRRSAIGGLPKVLGKQLDEYPPAMFKEGGAGASVRAISPKDNMAAGACIGNACRGLANGDKIRIKVVP